MQSPATTVPDRASLNFGPMAVTLRARVAFSVRATLVRPVLGVDARQPGQRLRAHKHQTEIPLDADAGRVLRLQRTHVLNRDTLPAVDAVQTLGAELDGENGARVIARLPTESPVDTVLRVRDEVVDEDGYVVVEVNRAVQPGGLTQRQVPTLGTGQLLNLPAAAPRHYQRVGRARLHLVYHLVQLRERTGAAGSRRPRQHVLAARYHAQYLVQAIEPHGVDVVNVPVYQLVLHRPRKRLRLHRQHHGAKILLVRARQGQEVVQVGVAARYLQPRGHGRHGRGRLHPRVARVVELGRPQRVLPVVRQGVAQDGVEREEGEHRRGVDDLFHDARQQLRPAVLVPLDDGLKGHPLLRRPRPRVTQREGDSRDAARPFRRTRRRPVPRRRRRPKSHRPRSGQLPDIFQRPLAHRFHDAAGALDGRPKLRSRRTADKLARQVRVRLQQRGPKLRRCLRLGFLCPGSRSAKLGQLDLVYRRHFLTSIGP